MVVLVVTPSLDPAWVRPLAAVRRSGITPIAVLLDPLAHLAASPDATQDASGQGTPTPSAHGSMERQMRALLHALAEHDVRAHVVRPGVPLGEQLLVAGSATGRAAA